jgi:hypothetical protein
MYNIAFVPIEAANIVEHEANLLTSVKHLCIVGVGTHPTPPTHLSVHVLSEEFC